MLISDPLHWAAASGDLEEVKKLIDKGANIDQKDGKWLRASGVDLGIKFLWKLNQSRFIINSRDLIYPKNKPSIQ